MSPTRTPHQAYRYRQREAARRRARRRILMIATVGVVAVVVIALIVAAAVNGSSTKTPALPTGNDAASIVQLLSSVPTSVTDPIGSGSATTKPTSLSGSALTADGKPKVLYIGAEFCPFCATERWAMVVALSRFGSFSNLGFTRSSGTDVFPNTVTLSFHGSTYTSDYITFIPVETATTSNAPLDTPSADDAAIWKQLDPNQTIPFLDIGGRYLATGATYDPSLLQNHNWSDIANALDDSNNPIARGVIGAANDLTAAICKATNDQPATACTPAIKAIEAQLG